MIKCDTADQNLPGVDPNTVYKSTENRKQIYQKSNQNRPNIDRSSGEHRYQFNQIEETSTNNWQQVTAGANMSRTSSREQS